MPYIPIFKTGKHTDSSGHIKEWTDNELDVIADKFNNQKSDELRDVPLVIGHPKTNSPAFGRVEHLKRDGNYLLAKFKDVTDTIKDAVNNGHYKKLSISVNPNYRLNHIGLLGAAQPAIAGLGDVQFELDNDSPLYDMDFTENENTSIIDNNENKQNDLFNYAGTQMTPDEIIAELKKNPLALNMVMKALGLQKQGAEATPDKPKPPQFSETELAQQAKIIELENKVLDMEFTDALKDTTLTIEQKNIAKNVMFALKNTTHEFAENTDVLANFKSILELTKPPVQLGRADFSAIPSEQVNRQKELQEFGKELANA